MGHQAGDRRVPHFDPDDSNTTEHGTAMSDCRETARSGCFGTWNLKKKNTHTHTHGCLGLSAVKSRFGTGVHLSEACDVFSVAKGHGRLRYSTFNRFQSSPQIPTVTNTNRDPQRGG